MSLCLFGCPFARLRHDALHLIPVLVCECQHLCFCFNILSLKRYELLHIQTKKYKQKYFISDSPFHQFMSSILPLQTSLSLSAKTSLPWHEGSRVVSRGYTTRRSSLPARSKRALTRLARLLNMTTTGDYCPASIPGATQ